MIVDGMKGFFRNILVVVSVLAVTSLGFQAFAQSQDTSVSAPIEAPEATGAETAELEVDISTMPSLFFTYWQEQELKKARMSRGFVRPATQAELDALEEGGEKEAGERDIRLGGIVYHGEDDWTIWINSKRITPTAIPEEVMGLKVYKDFIEVKWYDAFTNQIFPLRLRPRQRFNMDARIFLPG